MRLIFNEDKAYREYSRRVAWMTESWEWKYDDNMDEAKDDAWNIAWDMLWDAVHSDDGTAWREYDRLSSLIHEAHKAMDPYTVYPIDGDGEWLWIEA